MSMRSWPSRLANPAGVPSLICATSNARRTSRHVLVKTAPGGCHGGSPAQQDVAPCVRTRHRGVPRHVREYPYISQYINPHSKSGSFGKIIEAVERDLLVRQSLREPNWTNDISMP